MHSPFVSGDLFFKINRAKGAIRAYGKVTAMNSVPVKHHDTPQVVLENLIADVGLKTVVFALIGRVFAFRKGADTAENLTLAKQPGVEYLSDHLRKDLGLPPCENQQFFVDPLTISRRNLF